MGFSVGIDIDIEASGPVFDGSWEVIIHHYQHTIEEWYGDLAVQRIRQFLPTQYMYMGRNGGDPASNPVPSNAGYLVSQIHWDRQTENAVIVNDGGYPAMIYGPWIEGIGPGNLYFGAGGRTARGLPPRFPGYHAFSRVSHELNYTSDLANGMFYPFLVELND